MPRIQKREDHEGIFLLPPSVMLEDVPDRVTIRLPEDVRLAIAENMDKTASKSVVDVICNAVLVYNHLVTEKLAGNRPILEYKEGEETKYIPIFSD